MVVENTTWTVKSSLCSLLIQNFETSASGKIRSSCVSSLSKPRSVYSTPSTPSTLNCVPPCLGGGPAWSLPQWPTHRRADRIWEMESGFLVAVPGPRRTPSLTNGSWLLFLDLCPSRTEGTTRAKTRGGRHPLLGLAGRGVAGVEGGWQQPDPETSGPVSDQSHFCSTKVTPAVGAEGLRGSTAGQGVALAARDMVVGYRTCCIWRMDCCTTEGWGRGDPGRRSLQGVARALGWTVMPQEERWVGI